MLSLKHMHEPTKELDQLRRLAELLRQAWGAAGEGGPRTDKNGPAVKKLRRGKATTSVGDSVEAAKR